VLNTPYKNSVALADQPQFPGNLELESRNLGHRALERPRHGGARESRPRRARRPYRELRLGRDLFEVGFNHFFRAGQEGDLVYFSRTRARGIRARLLEGRLPEERLAHYRQETGGKGSLPIAIRI